MGFIFLIHKLWYLLIKISLFTDANNPSLTYSIIVYNTCSAWFLKLEYYYVSACSHTDITDHAIIPQLDECTAATGTSNITT